MSLWSELCLTYSKIASDPSNKDLLAADKFLLEDGLTKIKVGVEIALSKDGEVLDVSLVPKALQSTIIPATPQSMSRTSGKKGYEYPLFEKLDYMARDWNLIDEDNISLEKKKENFECYKETLGKWAKFSKFPQIKIIYEFISKAKIIELLLRKFSLKDLTGVGIQDKVEKDKEKEESEIDSRKESVESNIQDRLSVNIKKIKEGKNVKDIAGIFVRFKVYYDDDRPEVYLREDILREWTDNYIEILGLDNQEEIDYISGIKQTLKTFSPRRIRSPSDEAKLISSNDDTIRTFGGRFNLKDPTQPATIGQKSMLEVLYALRWLIRNNNALNFDNLVVLSWSIENIEEPDLVNILSKGDGKYAFNVESNKVTNSIALYGNRSRALDDFSKKHKVNVIVLDGESKGRISICYYNELDSTMYYKNLENWCNNMCWRRIDFKTNESKIRTPNFNCLFDLIHKDNKNNKNLKKHFYKEILPCIIERKPIPRYFVKSAFRKVCRPESFTNYFDWQENIFVACAIINKFYKKEKYMKLDTNETDRSYLFGRLLALAEGIERAALSKEEKKKQTNAERLFTRFTMRPGQTFSTLQKQLIPYFDKLYGSNNEGLAIYFKNQITEVLDKMGKEEFTSNKALNEMFILGYNGQLNYGRDKKSKEKNDENKGEE